MTSARVMRSMCTTALVASALAGCGIGGAGGGSSGSSVSVRTGTPYIGTFAPLYLAQQNGNFSKAGLNVTLLGGTGTLPVVQAVSQGQTDVALVDTAAASELIDQGLHVKVIALPQPLSDMGVVSFGGAGITSPAGLYGKRLAVTPSDSISALWPAFDSAAKLDTSKITEDQVAVASKATEVLQGRDNALLGYQDAQGAQLQVEGKKPTSTLLFSDYGIKITGYGLIANDSWLKNNPATAKKLVAAIVDAYGQALDDPQAAVNAGAKSNPTFSKADALAMLQAQNKEIAAERTPGKPIGWMSPQAWAASLKVLHTYAHVNDLEASHYYTNQYLPSS